MNILVTGAKGMVGLALCVNLKNTFLFVVCIVNESETLSKRYSDSSRRAIHRSWASCFWYYSINQRY